MYNSAKALYCHKYHNTQIYTILKRTANCHSVFISLFEYFANLFTNLVNHFRQKITSNKILRICHKAIYFLKNLQLPRNTIKSIQRISKFALIDKNEQRENSSHFWSFFHDPHRALIFQHLEKKSKKNEGGSAVHFKVL